VQNEVSAQIFIRWQMGYSVRQVHVKPSFKPKKLGEGVSATAYTFGKKLVIKHTDCEATIDTARKLRNKNVSVVAKVFEVGKVSRPYSEWQDYHDSHDSYYIIQEFVRKKRNAKVDYFCNNFESIAHAMADIDNIRMLKSFVNIALELKKSGIDLDQISDLHNQMCSPPRKIASRLLILAVLILAIVDL
jgi:hypothetical protein